MTRVVVMAALAAIAAAGYARTGYRRGWYGNYNEGGPAIGGWAGMKIGVWATLLLLLAGAWPYLHLGISESP